VVTDSYDLPRSVRLQDRWGHWSPQLFAVTILVAIALGFRPMSASLLSLLVSLFLMTFVLATWVFMRRHDRRLCEACAAQMPLNPTRRAEQVSRRLWVTHSGSRARYLIPYLAVLVGSNFLTSLAGRVVWAVMQLSMIYLILSYNSHRKLQPWCPWCSAGGGGTEVERPTTPDRPRGPSRQLV
jgi:hypothetical protein